MDLGSVLQGGGSRGETAFSELTGNIGHDRGVTQLRQLRLSQNNLSATGTLDIDAENNIRGRVAADIRLSTEQRRGSFAVTGNLTHLEWQRQ